jgi:hypothetical protein
MLNKDQQALKFAAITEAPSFSQAYLFVGSDIILTNRSCGLPVQTPTGGLS